MIMQKISKNSHFDVIRGDDLENYGNRILQIDSSFQYKNGGFGVYLCEIDDEAETTDDDK